MEKEKRKRSPDERKKNPTLGDEEDAKSSRSKKAKKSKESGKDRDSRDKSKHGKHKSHHKSSHAEEKRPGDKQKHGAHQLQELSTDDYFSKNNEFATWLKEEKSLFFSDLSSESARDLFSDFVKRWNADKLDSRYYEGIATGPRTSHKWNIKK